MSHLRHGRPHRIRGWGLIKAPSARLPQRRYMRLIHYTFSVFDSSNENTDLLIFQSPLHGSTVSVVKRRKEITIRLHSQDRIVITLRTEKEYDAWKQAFHDAARVASTYYKVVPSRMLGQGAFSHVYFGFDKDDGHHVAIKVLDKTRCTRAEISYAETEARMMAYVRHPSIVKCRDIFDAPDVMHVVMEYMSGSTLEQRMLTNSDASTKIPTPFSEPVAATVMSHLLSSLAYLEAEHIVHRDVKPDNILLSTLPNDTLWATSARLSDFGLAAFIESENDLTEIVGTPHYVAPEVIRRTPGDNQLLGYGPPVDVWAAGVVMYWMLCGELPFDGTDSSAVFRSIRTYAEQHTTYFKGYRPTLFKSKVWSGISEEAKRLLCALLHPDPNCRLRASAARVHPWLLCSQMDNLSKVNRGVRIGTRRRSGWRTVVLFIRAFNLFLESVDAAKIEQRRQASAEMERLRILRRQSKRNTDDLKQRAPERAPAGADGLGYNVGLIPSFAPKRRARAGGGDLLSRERISRDSTGGSSDGRSDADGRRSVEKMKKREASVDKGIGGGGGIGMAKGKG